MIDPDSLRRIRALLETELRAAWRDRAGVVGGVLFLLFVGLTGPIGVRVGERLFPEPPDDESASSAWDCKPGELGPVAVAGELPPWFTWPEPLVPAEDAEILIRPGPPGDGAAPPTIEVVELEKSTHRRAVQDCLWSKIKDERRERLDVLGITEDPRDLVRIEVVPPAPPRPTLDLPPIAPLTLFGGLAMVMMSVFLELGPLARQSGWLETFVVLPGRRRDLVIAWWLVGVLVSVVGAALVLLGDTAGELLTGVDTGHVPLLLLPPLMAVMSAVGVRAFIDVADIRTAMVQSIPVLLTVLLLGGLASALEARAAGLGGLMPLGGLALAVAGRTEGVALAVASSLVGTGLLLWDATRALEVIVLREGPVGQTAARRASGQFWPEVLLLVFVAMAGVGGWAPPELVVESVPGRTALSLILFLGVPALLINVPLRLDRAPLLSLGLPRPRAWLALPLLVAGTLALASEVWRLTLIVLPSSEFLDAYADAVGAFEGFWGLVAISVVPGICEELLFRGAILGLLRRRLPLWGAILAQAAAFAILHSLAVRLPYTFLLGGVFGLLVVRTGSLWPAIVAHTAHNLLSAVLPEQWRELPPWALWIVALVGLGGAWWLTRNTKR